MPRISGAWMTQQNRPVSPDKTLMQRTPMFPGHQIRQNLGQKWTCHNGRFRRVERTGTPV